MDHDNRYCNCEDCWWARGQQLVCETCGSVGDDCPAFKGQVKITEEIVSEIIKEETKDI